MSIRLIALDLDRTTLNAESRLSAGNKEAMEEAAKRGIHVVISTGRSFYALPEDVLQVRGIRYAITSNGAQLIDLQEKRVLYENCIGETALLASEQLLRRNLWRPMLIETFIKGVPYVEKSVYDTIAAGGKSLRNREYMLTTRRPMENMLDFMHQHADKVENINMFFEDKETMQAMWEELASLSDVTLTSSLDNNWEIGGATTSKAKGLEVLSERLNIRPDEIMACGDSPNDGAMLRYAGIGVAMGNAREEVKAQADFVAAPHDKDGVAEAIRKFALSD
ncbi:MAG: HAD family hydrolase [Eubacteriales bacterium]|nr:HAD family hydrolase [Eubacteriales bacterium]